MEAQSRKSAWSMSNGGGDTYYSGQRRRRKRRERHKRLKTRAFMPSLSAAIEAQSRLVGDAEPLFGDPQRTRQQKTSVPPLLGSPELQLRFLNPDDIPEVKRLCGEWFPIEYPDSWYADITSDERFYSVCAVYRGQMIGLIVAEIKDADKLPKEDSDIFAVPYGNGSKTLHIGYILSIGVVKRYRGNGVASFLLDNLVGHLTANSSIGGDEMDVRALYLHVLTTNSEAISFYENRGFRVHLFLPCYYAVNGKRKDGFTYVLYLNGGRPRWTIVDYLGHCFQTIIRSVSFLNPWHLTKAAIRKVLYYGGRAPIWPRLWQIAHS